MGDDDDDYEVFNVGAGVSFGTNCQVSSFESGPIFAKRKCAIYRIDLIKYTIATYEDMATQCHLIKLSSFTTNCEWEK